MIHYFYHFEYNHTVTESSEISPKLLDSMMYAVADKYRVPGLKRLARFKFASPTHRANSSGTRHPFQSTPDTDFGLRDICFCFYASIVLEGDGDLDTLVRRWHRMFTALPAMAVEIAAFTIFIQSKNRKLKGHGFPSLAEEFVSYLKLAGGESRANDLHSVLVSCGYVE